MKIVGIDPGIRGGLAMIGDGRVILQAERMPTLRVRIGYSGAERKWLDVVALQEYLELWQPDHVFIEQQYPTAGQGLSSTFTTAFNYGSLCASIVALDIPHTIVQSVVWKRALQITDKGTSGIIDMADRVWPEERDRWGRRLDGICAACLIGWFGLKAKTMEARSGQVSTRIATRLTDEEGYSFAIPQPVYYRKSSVRPH